MSKYKSVRGMRDLLFNETQQLNFIIKKSREIAKNYAYGEVITPLIESNELFSAKSGDEIRKRMFTFKDLGNRNVSLRPEFTASIARLAKIMLKRNQKPIRIFSVGSVYRYDEPQQGRYREFWQSNYELIGSNKPQADAELILLTNNFLKKTGLKKYFFKMGHIGILRGILNQEKIDESTQDKVLHLMDKKEFDKAFSQINKNSKSILKDLESIKEKNIFDTIEKINSYLDGYKEAKKAVKNLCEILTFVTGCGCPIGTIDPVFSRGLEYYTGVIFEVRIPDLNISLGGGGRYDRLIELFGGLTTPAVGVAHGLDRIKLGLQIQDVQYNDDNLKKVLIVPVTKDQETKAFEISENLRDEGIFVEFEVMGRKIGKAIQYASKKNINFVIIVGESELKTGMVVLKDLVNHEQITVKIENLIERIKRM